MSPEELAEAEKARLAELEKKYGEFARLPYSEIQAFLVSWRFEPTGRPMRWDTDGKFEEWGFPNNNASGWEPVVYVPTEAFLANVPIFNLYDRESRFRAIRDFAGGLLGTPIFDPVFGRNSYWRFDQEKFLSRFRSAPTYEEAQMKRLQRINRKIEKLESLRYQRRLTGDEQRELSLAEYQLREHLLNY